MFPKSDNPLDPGQNPGYIAIYLPDGIIPLNEKSNVSEGWGTVHTAPMDAPTMHPFAPMAHIASTPLYWGKRNTSEAHKKGSRTTKAIDVAVVRDASSNKEVLIFCSLGCCAYTHSESRW